MVNRQENIILDEMKNKKAQFQKKRAFTLIELLIVIAIIGILAGVILVSTSSARDKSKAASALSTIRSVFAKAQQCVLSGYSLNPPTAISGTGTIGAPIAICNDGSGQTLPDITKTGFEYLSGAGTWYGNPATGKIAITIRVDQSKNIVCAADDNVDGWYTPPAHPGVSYDFTGTYGCRKQGF